MPVRYALLHLVNVNLDQLHDYHAIEPLKIPMLTNESVKIVNLRSESAQTKPKTYVQRKKVLGSISDAIQRLEKLYIFVCVISGSMKYKDTSGNQSGG